jgi:superfamily II DNA or RNA helicase
MARSGRLKYAANFRTYQKSAINMARRYRDAFLKGKSAGAALVCHPTGTGKTAIIAGLSQACPEIGSVVVLTTREAVRDQLVRELAGNLFLDPNKFGLSERIELAKTVLVLSHGSDASLPVVHAHERTLNLLPQGLRSFAKAQFGRLVQDSSATLAAVVAQGRAVVVMTVQMLTGMDRRPGDANPIYAELAAHADLVLFDEGHYEPAAIWSRAVRGLKRPLVLLSATPFRNDLKPFQVEPDNIDIYKYVTAWNAGHVRRIEVRSREGSLDPEVFAADVIAFCEEEFGKVRTTWPRVIIHCDDKSRITKLGDAFVDRGFKVVGIHDRFPEPQTPRDWHYQKVPIPKDTEAEIWIHQYKLMEGIDDHRFRVVAFFDHMGNVRSVVQQIGRIIRVAPGEARQPAFVLDHYNGRVRQYWELYEDYDRELSKDLLYKSLSRFYLDKFIEALPKVDYIERKFRRLLEIEKVKDPADEILFERRVTFRRTSVGATLQTFVDLLESEFGIGDYEYSRCFATKHEAMFLYACIESPAFLHSRFFAEVRHGARLLLLLPQQRLLAIADTGASGGRSPLGALEPVKIEQLERVLTGGRITGVSSQNTNLGNRVVRRRTLSAPSIADVPPILDEHGHVLSTVTGYNGDRPRIEDDLDYLVTEMEISSPRSPPTAKRAAAGAAPQPTGARTTLLRRYVGLNSGRISEVGPPLRLKAFREWVYSLADQMQRAKPTPGVFNRYATVSQDRVARPMARNLLLDLYGVEDFYVHAKTGEALRGDDLCVDRITAVSDGPKEAVAQFEVNLNDERHTIHVEFSKKSKRYKLESPSLDLAFNHRTDANAGTLTRSLNDLQAFNIVPDELGLIYVHGRFYAPSLKFGKHFHRDNFAVGHCLYPSKRLRQISSEKGQCVVLKNGSRGNANGQEYDPDSLFGLIDAWREGFDVSDLELDPKWFKEYAPEMLAFEPTLVICDDMDDESADFFLVDEVERRFVMVHAKASSKYRPYSASAVQEVCAQAQKNTALLSLFSLRKPPNLEIWDETHRFKGTKSVSLSVSRRLRKPLGMSSTDAWARLEPLLVNPLTSREVWLVLGSMVSARTLAENLQMEDPPPEALQLNHLLQTTIAAMQSAGAKTRIFCVP